MTYPNATRHASPTRTTGPQTLPTTSFKWRRLFRAMDTTLYYACWRPEEIGAKTVADVLPMLIQGIHYMIDHRVELVKYNPENGWGTYEGFIKFLLNYKQACEDNDPECTITTWR